MPDLRNIQALAEDEAEAETPAGPPAAWPTLAPEAFHGLAGDFVRQLEPHTEADPVAILVQTLVMFGNVIGRNAYFSVEADRHYTNLFAVMVGETSKGRKGVSLGQAKRLFSTVDEDWIGGRFLSGLSSGEGLIWTVRDPIERYERVNSKDEAPEYDNVITDLGETDKRLVVIEDEFASTLRVMARQGSTLSPLIRRAWDTGDLSMLTKNTPARATGAHISIIGHVTRQELLRYLTTTEAGNGFGNRFLWNRVRRSKCLPEGGRSHEIDFGPLIQKLTQAVEFAREPREILKDDVARKSWDEVYPDLSEGKPGLFGAIIARAEAQTMRLACIYALLDRSPVVRQEHLLAALALWDFCETSARGIFGEVLGDPVADELLRALRSSPHGMTRTDIRDFFGRNRNSREVERALGQLCDQGLARWSKENDGSPGRPTERWFATQVQDGQR